MIAVISIVIAITITHLTTVLICYVIVRLMSRCDHDHSSHDVDV